MADLGQKKEAGLVTHRPTRETINAMRHTALIALTIAACSGDDGPPGNGSADAQTVDPATAHELVDCDRASYDPVVQLPAGWRCERACEVLREPTGATCDSSCGLTAKCTKTLDFGGLDGCCISDSNVGQITFCECE